MSDDGKRNKEGTAGWRLQQSAYWRYMLGVVVAGVGLASLLIGGAMFYKYAADSADPNAFATGAQERLMSIGMVLAVVGVSVAVAGSRILRASNEFCVVLVSLLILLIVEAPNAVPLPLYRNL